MGRAMIGGGEFFRNLSRHVSPPTRAARLHAARTARGNAATGVGSTGSVLRFDEMTGTWVVFASGRRDRPRQTESAPTRRARLADLPSRLGGCPFCGGNEHMTPETLLAVGDAMRVVPNKFPAVGPFPRSCGDGGGGGGGSGHGHQVHAHEGGAHPFSDHLLLNNEVPAVGFHEVVIESPDHDAHLATAPDRGHARDLLTAFRDRGRSHREVNAGCDSGLGGIEHTVFFKNHGATAGASLVHPHSQIVSTPVVPVEAQRLQTLALQYFRKNRVSLYERVVEEEVRLHEEVGGRGSRVVEASDNFLAVVPYASPGPYDVTILPRFGGDGTAADGGVDCSDFTTATDDLIDECASVLRSSLRRIHSLLDEPCFNLVVQTAPVPGRGVQAAVQASAFFRWHVRITPRLGAGAMAGFELGSGFFSNSHMPEDDAAALRAVSP